MKYLTVGPHLRLPADEAVTQKQAFIGRTGSGKTYGAMKHAEQLLLAGAQVIAIDWVGVWWGLRLQPSGKAAADHGQPLYIFGGEHGDIPLAVDAGDKFARMLVERGVSAVLDVSQLRKAQRQTFVTAFAEEWFHAKKANRAPVHLYLEEAQAFLPQMVQRGSERMLGAFEDIGKVGRNYGIGLSLITQRPQAVHKDVLNQSEVLYLFQLSGPQERKAVEGWAVDVAGEKDSATLDRLPHLTRGTCVLWSPQWLQRKEEVAIGARETFDVTPKALASGKRVEPRPLGAAELTALGESMQAVVKQAEATDVKALQRRVRELEQQARLPPPIDHAADLRKRLDEAQKQLKGRHGVDLQQLEKSVAALSDLGAKVYIAVETVTARLLREREALTEPAAPPAIRQPAAARPVTRPPQPVPRPRLATGTPAASNGHLGKMELAIVAALARYGPMLANRLTLLTRYTYNGSFRNALSKLRTEGWIQGGNTETMTLVRSADGLGTDISMLPEGDALVEHWLTHPRFGAMERAILSALLERPKGATADQLVEATNYTYNGSFRNALSKLRTAGVLIGRNTDVMRPHDDLVH